MAKNTFKLSTMVGEKFEFYLSQMAKNTLKLSTMVAENFENKMAKNQDFGGKSQNIKTTSRHQDHFWNIKTKSRKSRHQDFVTTL